MNERTFDITGVAVIGAAIGVLFMPMLGPLALVAGAAIGGVIVAAIEARRATR